ADAARGGRTSRPHRALGNLLSIDRDGAAEWSAGPVALAAEPWRRRAARAHAVDAADRSEGAAARDVLRYRREHPRWRSVPALGKRAPRQAEGSEYQGHPRRALPADGPHAAAWPSAAAQDRANAALDRDHVRRQPGPT